MSNLLILWAKNENLAFGAVEVEEMQVLTHVGEADRW